ncbi:MAG: hypothetical protein NC231_04925 [Bacillus sp. (in: Bacteria)]|nr:hypothetical protein [Bacillus sp. (in: firmicutes)]MCM1426846.1 hypothetical protein [Eubacterium sp.]
MDKYEYKVRADEIKALIAEGDFAEAVKIADTIDWRRVKSVMMLCSISDLYKINRRYQESKDILLLAYEKHPTARPILYSLCELAIKMEEYVQAIEYYKEFVQLFPKDTGKYILQYRLYEAQDVSLEERIAVLEEFKKRDLREKWMYELAYLYHRIGLETKCIEECDEVYIMFGEGKYVQKALELKALHMPLSTEQQTQYDKWIKERDEEAVEEDVEDGRDDEEDEERSDEYYPDDDYPEDEEDEEDSADIMSMATTELPEVKTVDVGQYNTINLQMALAESMKEILTDTEEENPVKEDSADESMDMEKDASDDTLEDEETADESSSIVEQIIAPLLQETVKMPKIEPGQETDELQEITAADIAPVPEAEPELRPEYKTETPGGDTSTVKYDDVLSQENDGQIRLVVPDIKAIEKQITGQLSIEDVMAEWEAMKKENEQKRREAVRQRILEHTGSLFADFDEATKSGLLEQLEKAFVAAIMKESGKQPGIKKVISPEDAQQELGKSPQPVEEPKQEIAYEEAADEEIPVSETEPEISQEPDMPDELMEEGIEDEEAAEDIAETETADEIEETDVEEETSDSGAETETTKTADEAQPRQGTSRTDRELTEEEKTLFGQFVHHKKSREQLIHTLDNMSMAAYTGNVIITGEEGSGTLSLAKGLIREMQYNDGNFSGKVAKISGAVFNKKDITETLAKINNGALIIEKASDLKAETVARLAKALEKDNIGLLLILEDTKQKMNRLLVENSILNYSFELRIDIEPLDDEALVAYAKQYAEQMEYSIDEFGVLALHTRIADMQTSDHEVSVAEVRDLVDEAIYYANKKTPKHFVDILLAKRYDDEDMIILRENDFMHY